MKPNKTFKLPKRVKTLMSLLDFKDEDTRHSFKAMMIQGQLASFKKAPSSRDAQEA